AMSDSESTPREFTASAATYGLFGDGREHPGQRDEARTARIAPLVQQLAQAQQQAVDPVESRVADPALGARSPQFAARTFGDDAGVGERGLEIAHGVAHQ